MSEQKTASPESTRDAGVGAGKGVPFSEAYWNYLTAAYNAHVSFYTHLQEIARSFHKNVKESQYDFGKLGDAYRTNCRKTEEAWKVFAQRFEEGYRQYLRTVQGAFGQMDVDKLSPAQLYGISQTLEAASQVACHARSRM
jgi:hypothetical protein